MMLGGIEPGNWDAQCEYQRCSIKAFIPYLGEDDIVKTATTMGAVNVDSL